MIGHKYEKKHRDGVFAGIESAHHFGPHCATRTTICCYPFTW